MTNPHDRTHPMDLLERKFQNDAEAHHLLAIFDAAMTTKNPNLLREYCVRVRRCVEEHIRLSGDVYDRR
jgi:hypothetical protein